MIKSEKPSKVWKNLNNYPELTKIESLVDETTSKFFWIINNKDTDYKKQFVISNRIYNSLKLSDNKKHFLSVPFSSLNNIIKEDISVKWKAFELFLQYFIEKYWKIKITPVPAELDINNKVDFIFDYQNIKIWFDVGVWNNVMNKRSKILKHSKNVDKTKKSNFNKRKTSKRIKWKWSNFPVNLEYFSNKFLYDTNWIITINPINDITKRLDLKNDIKDNFLLDAYNCYIEDWWKNDIEEYIPNKSKDEFILVWKILPKVIDSFINFMKNNKKWVKIYKLDNFNWEVKIQYNIWEINSITMDANLWEDKINYLSLFIPVTKKLLKKLHL